MNILDGLFLLFLLCFDTLWIYFINRFPKTTRNINYSNGVPGPGAYKPTFNHVTIVI